MYRALNRDGTDNINRSNKITSMRDIYHNLLSYSWPKFLTFLALAYFITNLTFGLMYFAAGPQALNGIHPENNFQFFTECFFFSIHTLSTIGYGTISPANLTGNVIVAIEAFCGMLSVGLVTGLFFSRFSRPTSRVLFSENALITNHMGKRSLVFRMANARMNQVSEANLRVVLLKNIITPEGISIRQQYDLEMVRSYSIVFSASWLVAHVIDESSPLFNLCTKDLQNMRAEIIISLTGYDQTFAQTIHARSSYIAEEVIFDRYFEDMVTVTNDELILNLDKISALREPNSKT